MKVKGKGNVIIAGLYRAPSNSDDENEELYRVLRKVMEESEE